MIRMLFNLRCIDTPLPNRGHTEHVVDNERGGERVLVDGSLGQRLRWEEGVHALRVFGKLIVEADVWIGA